MTSFSDDFNRADTSDLGPGWVEVSGNWSIVSQQLSPGATGGTIILRAAGAMDTNDNYAQVTIAATAAVSQGVWCRGNSNISSGYLLRNNGSSWDLFQVVGGSFTMIGTYTAAAAPGDVVKVQAVGSTIKGFINGVERISVTDTGVTTGTSVGIRGESTNSLRYDDFTAGDVTAGVTLGVASESEAAQALTGSKAASLGTAAEADAAQALTGAKTAALPVASETDAGQGLTGSKAASLGTAAEAESAQPLTGTKTGTLPTADEQDAAQALSGGATAALGTAGSVETAQPLVGAKTATLSPAGEHDTARPLTAPSTVTPSPERTHRVLAARRRVTVPAGHRILIVRR